MSDAGPPTTVRELPTTSTIRILLVDDHELLRDGLRELLANQDDLHVCGEAAGENEAMEVVRASRPHLVLVDVALQQGDGINLTKRIKAHDDSIQVVVCSMYDENLYAARSLRAGASGYVHKQAPARAVLDAIRQVLAGGVYLSPAMAQRMTCGPHACTQPAIEGLADRELEVLTLIGSGLMNAQIADQLGLSPRTVETYRERLKAKLNLKTAGELNRRAVQWVLKSE